MSTLNTSPIKLACKRAGSQAQLAKVLEVSSVVVNQWVHGRRPVPAVYCPKIEQETGVSRKELRPDDWHLIWPELATETDGPIVAPSAPMNRRASDHKLNS